MKHDLLKLSQIIEASTESLKCHDYNSIEPTEIQQILEGAHLNWVKYLQVYEEYSRLINDSSELERLSIQRRTLERNLNDCNQLAIDQLDKSIRSLQRGSIPVDDHHFNDDERISLSAHSSISMSRSSKGRHSVGSSVSSKARAAARSAELAKLKLEQAERRAKTKQKQMQEQIEQELQDLRDQAEYSRLEAHLLAADQAGDRFSDRSSKRSWPKIPTENKANIKIEIEGATTKHENTCEASPSLIPHDSTNLPLWSDQVNPVEALPKSCEQEKAPSPACIPTENSKQDFTHSIMEMNQQLVGVVKQGVEVTTVMKAMLQRQEIPKPQPIRFNGDPAQFPVFKKRVESWLVEREFDEREKITRLLSFVEGDAKDAILHCELKSDGYTEVMNILESQYGHPSSVVKASLKRVTVGPRIEKGDSGALAKLRNNLRACLEVLKDNKSYEHEINASSNVKRVVDRLPMHMQIEWVKKVPKIRDETKLNPTLEHVMDLIENQLKIMNDPQYGHILTAKRKPLDNKSSKCNDPSMSSKTKSPPSNHISTLATNLEASNACPCCKGKHLLINCDLFAKKTPEERWEIVKVSRLCHLCLASGHMKAQCKSTTICRCKSIYKHHRLLHRRISPPNDDLKCQSKLDDHNFPKTIDEGETRKEPRKPPEMPRHDTSTPEGEISQKTKMSSYATMTEERGNHILLHVVPVKVLTKNGDSVTTYGLLDNASCATVVDVKLAEKLNVKGTKQSVAVTTVLGTQDCEFELVSLFLQAAEARDTDPILEVSEGLVKELDMNERVLPNEIDCQRYEHLADITMLEVEFKQVSIIIGEDVRRAHIVREVRVSDDDECQLYATRTALGWTVAGSLRVNGTSMKELSINFLDTNNQILNRQVERFWEIETSGLKKQSVRSLFRSKIAEPRTSFREVQNS